MSIDFSELSGVAPTQERLSTFDRKGERRDFNVLQKFESDDLERRLPLFGELAAKHLLGNPDHSSWPDLYRIDDEGYGTYAYAHHRDRDDGQRGAILLGNKTMKHMVERFVDGELDGTPVIFLIAHEYAHIWQYRSGYWKDVVPEPTSPRIRAELHADLLAGWFLHQVENDLNIQREGLDLATEWAMTKGIDQFGLQQHYGTRSQRFAAVMRGYFEGLRGTSTITEISEIGHSVVESFLAHIKTC